MSESNRKPFQSLGVPMSVAHQNHDLLQLTRICAANSEHIVYVEDDFTLCERALPAVYSTLLVSHSLLRLGGGVCSPWCCASFPGCAVLPGGTPVVHCVHGHWHERSGPGSERRAGAVEHVLAGQYVPSASRLAHLRAAVEGRCKPGRSPSNILEVHALDTHR